MNQQTIKTSVQLSGIGLHTGKYVNLTLRPAPINHGYKFVRIDLQSAIIEADVSNVSFTTRGTVISKNNASVSTVEHLLAALRGNDIDNVIIEIDGPEVPIFDGSALSFIQAIANSGIITQNCAREYIEIHEKIYYYDEKTETELTAYPSNDFVIDVSIDFNSDILKPQSANLKRLSHFNKEIANCRTFVFLHDILMLLDQGLIKGGDLDNAIVIADKPMTDEQLEILSLKLGKPKIAVDKGGILNTIELHFDNEPARHKLLDVIGDLALVGKFIKGHIVANKPGHSANVAFAKLIKQQQLKGER